MSVRSCTVTGRDEAINVSGNTWKVTSLRAVGRDLSTPPIAFLRGVAEAALHCTRRTSTFLACAFREQEDDQAAPVSFLEWGTQFLLCLQHFPACLPFVPTFHALPDRSLRTVVEELIYKSITSEIPIFLVIHLVSPLQFIRRSCHSRKEFDHVLVDVHDALQPPSLPDACCRHGRREPEETGQRRALITCAGSP
jgi:hypothetical protein